MHYAVEPDIHFLSDALYGLAKLNVRHFRKDFELAKTVLRRMQAREYQWIVETPDTWQDVVQMADPKQTQFDCEDFAAALAALMVICFGEAQVGIRCVDHQCHALAGKDGYVFDICPLFGMPGRSYGAGEWRTIKETPMLAEGLELITSGVRRLMAESKEKPPAKERLPLELQLETGASLSNILTSLLPPAAVDKLEALERNLAATQKERDVLKRDLKATQKERDALKKGLADCNISRSDESARRSAAETTVAKTREQLNAESRRLAEAKAFHTACKEQLQQVLARSTDEGAKQLAQEGLDRLEQEKPEDYAEAFADDDQRDQAWEMLGTGAAHIASLPDCDACRRGEPCTGTGGADEANGDESPLTTSGPDSDNFVGGYEGPPSSDRPLSMSGCDGTCPR